MAKLLAMTVYFVMGMCSDKALVLMKKLLLSSNHWLWHWSLCNTVQHVLLLHMLHSQLPFCAVVPVLLRYLGIFTSSHPTSAQKQTLCLMAEWSKQENAFFFQKALFWGQPVVKMNKGLLSKLHFRSSVLNFYHIYSLHCNRNIS